jgi:hypothetical protein
MPDFRFSENFRVSRSNSICLLGPADRSGWLADDSAEPDRSGRSVRLIDQRGLSAWSIQLIDLADRSAWSSRCSSRLIDPAD